MHPLLVPGRRPWRIKALIGTLLLAYVMARFFIPKEPAEIETLSMRAEVISKADTLARLEQSATFRLVKLRLADGKQAFVSWQDELPRPGDTVDVLVTTMDDGTSRVSLPEF